MLNWDAASWSPPTLTRTWFHTGAFEPTASVSQRYASEYWTEPALRASNRATDRAAMLLPDTALPPDLDPFETREAYRALKGQMLRTEIYADDGTPKSANPYSVVEQNFTLQRLQTIGPNQHAVFFSHSRETVTFNYERSPDVSRVAHAITLEVDRFGNVLRSVSVGYPRRTGYAPPEPSLSAAAQAMLGYDQGRLHLLATEHQYTNDLADPTVSPDTYRVPLPAASIAAEITGVVPSANHPGITNRFAFDELDGIWKSLWGGGHDIPYEAIPASDIDGLGTPAASPTRRIIELVRTLYRSDDLSTLLDAGQLQSLALPGESYRAALTPGLLSNIFGALTPPTTLTEAGYVQLPGATQWWIPSGRLYYSAGDSDTPAQELSAAEAHFFTPRRAIDPFGAITRTEYDAYDLLAIAATDPVLNITRAGNDYRVLLPALVTDPNGNRGAVRFDILGLVVGIAVMGKTTETVGDSFAVFTADLDDTTIQKHLSDPLAQPEDILGTATTRIVYDPAAYYRSRESTQPSPPAVYTLARETHVSDLGPGQETLFRHTFAYSDGFAREIQRKTQAEVGPVAGGGPRWIGSGWTLFNNKAQPVRRYEPFFSSTQAFEFAAQIGVSSILFYDPPGRVIATLHPDNTWEKVVFDSWRQESWDGNDTGLLADPRNDPDVSDQFLRLLGVDPGAFVSWHDLRIGGTYGPTAEDRAAQQDAAQKTEAHAATPTVVHLDALGRTCLTVADNGPPGRYPSRVALDIEGKPLAVFDAAGRRVVEYCLRLPPVSGAIPYVAGSDMAGNPLYQNGMDSGARRSLVNVAGKPIRTWDARGHAFSVRYDLLQRPTHRSVSTNGAPPILIERSVYGEGLPDANLCGRLFRQYDTAGVAISNRYDFKGNLLSSARQLAVQYWPSVDWSVLANLTDAASLDAAAKPLLVADDRFDSDTVYDALNRPIQVVTPHTAQMRPNVLRPSYNEAGLLNRVDVWLQQAVAPTSLLDPATADIHAVTGIQYNAWRQRVALALGNGTVTTFSYDPQTFRLTHLTTTRPNTFSIDQRVVQDLFYYYDPAGNITHTRDSADAQDVIFFQNQRVEPSANYTYDPIYRLIRATGREHLGQTGGALLAPQQVTNDDSFRTGQLQPWDGRAMGTYTETYSYDPVGNLLAMLHQVSSGAWTRRYSYVEPSQITPAETGNRLSATSLPGDPVTGPYSAAYAYDVHGNMVRMPHLPQMTWDEEDRLRSTTRQVMNNGTPPTTYYVYDGAGPRVRKTTNGLAPLGQIGPRQAERLYLGAVEIYREFAVDGTTVTLQRETLHVDAGPNAVAVVETRTIGVDRAPVQLVRYQYRNHLGSASLELDDQAQIISYEEYFPYGSTSYQAVRSQTDTPKRYRYTDKERDEENDLNYHGTRYYAPWLGKWISCDPAGIADGPNQYSYVGGRVINLVDPSGLQGDDLFPPDPSRQVGEAEHAYVVAAKEIALGVAEGGKRFLRGLLGRSGPSLEDLATGRKSPSLVEGLKGLTRGASLDDLAAHAEHEGSVPDSHPTSIRDKVASGARPV
jgi:RHS repeat-associated protein